MKMKTTKISLTPELFRLLEEQKIRHGTPYAETVRRALNHYFSNLKTQDSSPIPNPLRK